MSIRSRVVLTVALVVALGLGASACDSAVYKAAEEGDVDALVAMAEDTGEDLYSIREVAVEKLGKLGTSEAVDALLAQPMPARAAPSTSRDRSNCTEMLVEPCEFTEVSSVTPAISPRRFSIGAAIVDAMICGSAPGRVA